MAVHTQLHTRPSIACLTTFQILNKIAVVDKDEARAEEFAKRFDFQSHATDWQNVIDRRDVDIVAIATPNNTHKEISLAALEAGKHVYCEKPLAVH